MTNPESAASASPSQHLRRTSILAIEAMTARAWPAADVAEIAGWRLHAGRGKVMRTNSCWPQAWRGGEIGPAISQVEAWYARLGLSPAFKLVDEATRPETLPQALAARGYAPCQETLVMTAPLGAHTPEPGVIVSPRLDPDFAAVLLAAGDDVEDSRERMSILARVPAPAGFARIAAPGGGPGGVGVAALERSHVGVLAMRTAVSARRQGLARRVLTALLTWAQEQGARTAWLQVEASNIAARRLYEAQGFSTLYRYRYWLK